MTKQIKEGKRWAGIKNVLKQGNLGMAATTVAGVAGAAAAAGGPPGIAGAAALGGAVLAGAHKDIANDYRHGKKEYEYNKKNLRKSSDSFYERSGMGARIRKQAGIKEETVQEGARLAGLKKAAPAIAFHGAMHAATAAPGIIAGSPTVAAAGLAANYIGRKMAGVSMRKDIANDYRRGKAEHERYHGRGYGASDLIRGVSDKIADKWDNTRLSGKHSSKIFGLGKQKMKEDIEDIIAGTVEGDAGLVKSAVDNVLANKVAEKIEQIRFEKAQNMFGDAPESEEDDGREKLPVDDDEIEFDDENEDLDLDEFEEEDEDSFPEIEYEEEESNDK